MNIRNWEVPWDQRHGDTDRLLHSEDAASRQGSSLYGTSNPLSLSSEPPCEAERVVNLSLSLSEGLAGLMGDNLGEIFTVLADQVVPFKQPLSSRPGRNFSEGLEGFMSCDYSGVGIVGIVVWGRGPHFAVAGILGVSDGNTLRNMGDTYRRCRIVCRTLLQPILR